MRPTRDVGRRNRCVALAAAVIVASTALPATAHAGMPSVSLTDLGRMRLDALSFFGVGFLLSAWGIKSLWNRLQVDFPKLPRLTYPAAVGVVFLWGLLFVLVLTMISGARELMTPGAWEKQGLTYKLKSPASDDKPGAPINELTHRREQQLQKLHVALLTYAARHDGQYPAGESAQDVGAEYWTLPERVGARYLYVPGRSLQSVSEVVAYEPQVYGDRQLVLWADGRIQQMTSGELEVALHPGDSP